MINKDSIKPPNFFPLIFQTKNVKAVKGGIVANPEVTSYQHFRTLYIAVHCFFPFLKLNIRITTVWLFEITGKRKLLLSCFLFSYGGS